MKATPLGNTLMPKKVRKHSDLYFDYKETEGQYFDLHDLKVGQKVFVGLVYTTRPLKIVPGVVLAILSKRVRFRVPSPEGEFSVTTVRTVAPKFITPRNVFSQIVDCESNKSHQERTMEKNQPLISTPKNANL
jgi:hypothetical protein